MDTLSVIGYVAGAFGLIAVVASAFIVVKGTTAKTTISQQKELIEVLTASKLEQKEQIVELTAQHLESIKAISNMQGQIDLLKGIPLVNIDTTLKEISKFNKSLAESNAKILEQLQKK